MVGPHTLSPVVESALRVRPRPTAEPMLDGLADFGRAARTDAPAEGDGFLQGVLDLPKAKRPSLVVVGIGRNPPPTTQSLIEKAADRGLAPGEDIVATRYADLRVGKERGFVRLADGTGEGGRVLAGQGNEALFLFRGGGNLSPDHLRKIGMIQAVDGATALTDLSFIQRAGSKAVTHEKLEQAGLALATTRPVHGEAAAAAAFAEITERFGADVAVLKKVNSLGGKDVHFVRSAEEARAIIRREPDADYVMQEFLPDAKDQDVRAQLVWNRAEGRHALRDSYVRNRNAFQQTPNLANGGFPTGYVLSPWEEDQVVRAAAVLSKGSPTPPLHVAFDLFPRRPITASVTERHQQLRDAVADGSISWEDAVRQSADTAVIGEAASSAGTKGTELVRGAGVNPVTASMVEAIIAQMGASGRSKAGAQGELFGSAGVRDSARGAAQAHGQPAVSA